MRSIETEDPTVFIEDIGAGWVIYRTKDGKERWIIHGTCNQCGECEVGSDNPNLIWTGIPVGNAGACYDELFGNRRDVPVRPEIKEKCPNCTLTGEYLSID